MLKLSLLIVFSLFVGLKDTIAQDARTPPWSGDFDSFSCQEVLSPTLPDYFKKNICKEKDLGNIEFNILEDTSRPGCKRSLVLLGNVHIEASDNRGMLAMYHSLGSFKFRGVESIEKDYLKLREYSGLKEELDERKSFLFQLKLWLKGGSNSGIKRIIDEKDRGFYFGREDQETYINGHLVKDFFVHPNLTIMSEQLAFLIQSISQGQVSMADLETPGCEEPNLITHSRESVLKVSEVFYNPVQFLQVFKSRLEASDFPPVTINIEKGDLPTYNFSCSVIDMALRTTDCKRYLLTERNKRMANNIRNIMDQLPCGSSFAAGMGVFHIGPLSRVLEKLKFEESSSTLSKGSYTRFGHDPDFPKD